MQARANIKPSYRQHKPKQLAQYLHKKEFAFKWSQQVTANKRANENRVSKWGDDFVAHKWNLHYNALIGLWLRANNLMRP